MPTIVFFASLLGSAGRSTIVRSAFSLLILLSILSGVATAHPEGFSGMHVKINADSIRVELTVHTRDMNAWFPPGKYPDYVADVTAEMEKTIDEIVELQIGGKRQPIAEAKAFLLEVGLIEIDVEYGLPGSGEESEVLIWSKHLIWLPRGHQQLLFVEDRRTVATDDPQGVMLLDDVLSIERDAGSVILPKVEQEQTKPAVDAKPVQSPEDVGAADPPSEAARQPKAAAPTDRPTSRISFFRFGVEHILSGYDHLLFLAALLLACNTFLEAAKIVTCFTIAHSITLAMAALDVVRLPGAIVEPLIAASIIYVAIENLSAKPSLWRRTAITFFFGLIHGLGFASALREIGLGTIPGGVTWPLLKFNLGVEAGQLCVAAIFLPLLLRAKRTERIAKRIVLVGSLLVASIGAYWLITRIVSQLGPG